MSRSLSRMEPLGGYANYGAKTLSSLTGVSERTARRWIKEGLAPRAVLRCLTLLVDGRLEALSPQWAGWRLRNDKLHAPSGAAFSAIEVLTIPLRLQQIHALEAERRR